VIAGVFLSALALVLAGFLRPRVPAQAAPSPAPGQPRVALIALLCALLTALFLVQLRAIEITVATQWPFPRAFAGLPLVPIDEAPPFSLVPPWFATTILALTIAQTAVLFALYRALLGRRLTLGTGSCIGVSCALMLAAALRTPALTSDDLYLYVAYAHLGFSSYAPAAAPFHGEFSILNKMWGLPILSAAYGPLWIGVARLSLLAGPTLGAQLAFFRIAGALSFCACLWLVSVLRRDAAVVALFALNPALLEQYVADGHNDLFGLVLTLLAFLAVRRSTAAAVVLVAAAGAAKLPYALIGSLAFATLSTPARRIAPAALAIALGAAASEIFSGGHYVLSAIQVAKLYAYRDAFTEAVRFAVAAVAVAAVAFALAARRLNRGASWSFMALGTELFPWYAAWGIPYALLEGSWFCVYLLSLPLVAFNVATYEPSLWTRAAYGFLQLAPLLPLAAFLRERFAGREARNASRRTPGL
jgi:hypothetical protein